MTSDEERIAVAAEILDAVLEKVASSSFISPATAEVMLKAAQTYATLVPIAEARS